MCEFEAHTFKDLCVEVQSQPGRSAGHGTRWNSGQQSVVLCAPMWNAVWTVPAGWAPARRKPLVLVQCHRKGSALAGRGVTEGSLCPFLSRLWCGVAVLSLPQGLQSIACLLSGGDDQCSGYHEGGLWSGENQRLENVQQPPPEQAPQEAEAGGRLLCGPGLQQPVRAETKDLWVEGKS